MGRRRAIQSMNAATSSRQAARVNAANRTRFWPQWPARIRSGGLTAYLVCFASVALATLLRFALDPLLGEHHAFTLYFAAVAITAWFGGFTPSLVATLLSYFAGDWFFISPRHHVKWPHVNLDDFIALSAFVFSCLAISLTSKFMRDAVLRARQKQMELEHEIEERRRAEQALHETQAQLRSYAGELERRVEERTANLQETIRSLEGVCYHIAHDLRAPLRAMDGFSTILMREYAPRLDEEGQYILQQIISSAGRMDLLIQGLLAYGRLGHAEFPVSPVAPKPLIERVIEHLNGEIVEKHAEIHIANEWPDVIANEALLETVLSNYIKNGLKFVAAESSACLGARQRHRHRARTVEPGLPDF